VLDRGLRVSEAKLTPIGFWTNQPIKDSNVVNPSSLSSPQLFPPRKMELRLAIHNVTHTYF